MLNPVDLTSALGLLDYPVIKMMEDQRGPHCKEGIGGGGCWGPPPPIFDLPPPPKPPWMEHCNDQPEDFNTRPLTSSSMSIGDHTSISNRRDPMVIQDSCDINPLVIDSEFFMGENLFTILVIVICSLILVAIVLVVACVIYRRRTMFRRLYSDGSKSFASFPNTMSTQQQQPNLRLDPRNQQQPPGASVSSKSMLTHFSNNKKSSNMVQVSTPNHGHCANMEMTENCHVYSNPSYPGHHFPAMTSEVGTMQIGGLPFYLPQQQSQESSVDSPSHIYEETALTKLASKQHGGLTTSSRPITSSTRLPVVPQASVIVPPSADNEVAMASMAGGPIYEDIDRMCSYRGYPPDLQQQQPQNSPQQPTQSMQAGIPHAQQLHHSAASSSNSTGGSGSAAGGLNHEDYYNLSGGSSPRNKSSNSEVSFEGASTRLRTMSPASNSHRSPQSVYSARLASRPANSSVYYYSDTLRKGRVGSDSGISVDTPPPKMYQPRMGGRPPLPSAAIAAQQTEVILKEPRHSGPSTSGKKRRNDTQV